MPISNSSPSPSDQNNLNLAYYIWHWQPKTQTARFVGPAITDHVQTVRRTGTDIQMEEQGVEGPHSRRPRSPTQSSPTTNNLDHSNGDALGGQMVEGTTFDYYQLHWFWIVVPTIFGGAIVAVVKALVFVDHAVDGLPAVVDPLLFLVFPSIVFTGIFLVISKFHTKLGQKVEKILKIPRERQRRWLRISAWCSFGLIMLWNIILSSNSLSALRF